MQKRVFDWIYHFGGGYLLGLMIMLMAGGYILPSMVNRQNKQEYKEEEVFAKSYTLFSLGNGDEDWWNTGWAYRRLITINSSYVNAKLDNFPVLVYLDSDSSLNDNAQSDGDDIAFINWHDNNTQFNHEIENYTSGTLYAWVNVTEVNSNTDTYFWMYYGNSTCGYQGNNESTWDGNYTMVQHMKDGTSNIIDSTSYDNDGTRNGNPTTSTGIIYNAVNFDNSGDYFNCGSDSSLGMRDNLTVEAWVKPDTLVDDGIVGHFSGTYSWTMWIENNNFNHGIWTTGAGWPGQSVVSASANTGFFQYVVATYDKTTNIIYYNGSIVDTDSFSTSASVPGDLYVGVYASSTYFFDGLIDEVRISNFARNSSWINATYNTIHHTNTFLTVGNEEEIDEREWTTITTWNGSIFNQTYYNELLSWNGTVYNASEYNWQTIIEWNGTICNTSQIISLNLSIDTEKSSYNSSDIYINITDPPGDTTFGNDYSGSNVVSSIEDYIVGSIFNSGDASGTLNSMTGTIYHDESTGSYPFMMLIYKVSDGSFVGKTEEMNVPASTGPPVIEQIELDADGDYTIEADTNYWLCMYGDGQVGTVAVVGDNSGGTCERDGASYPTIPNPEEMTDFGSSIVGVYATCGGGGDETCQSKINNTGNSNVTAYLDMWFQYNNSGTWINDTIIVNNQEITINYTGNQVPHPLDQYWNGSAYTSNLSFGTGEYRINATLYVEPDGAPLQNDDGSWVTNTTNFTYTDYEREWQTISSWNGTIYNISAGFSNVIIWNGSIYNASTYNEIQTWNGTIYNATELAWQEISSWNGSIYNESYYNTQIEWNGTIYNATVVEWTSIDEWNGTIYNQTNYVTLLSWNGTIYNTSSYQSVSQWNGTIYNLTVVSWTPISTWNGTIYNRSNYETINMWNGSIYNRSSYNNVQEWNGTIYNSTALDWVEISIWNGTIYNLSEYNDISTWNGTVYNTSYYNTIREWNGTIWNSTITGWAPISTWNGTIYNMTDYQQLFDWNGTVYNITYYNNVTEWNGTIYNASQYAYNTIEDWNGTIYNISGQYKTIDAWNGTIYNNSDSITFTFINMTPSNIRINTTGPASVTYNISTGWTALNESSIILAHVINNTLIWCLNNSYTLCADNWVPNKSVAGNRNLDYWFEEEFNATHGDGTLGYIGQWDVHNATLKNNITINSQGANWINITQHVNNIEHIYGHMHLVDHHYMVEENKSLQIFDVYRDNIVQSIFNMTDSCWYKTGNYNNTVYSLHVYASPSAGTTQPLRVYFANDSYKTGNPTLSPYTELIGQIDPTRAYDFTTRNSSYYHIEFSTDADGYVGTLNMTSNFSIIYETVQGNIGGKWDIYYADNNVTEGSVYHDFMNASCTQISSNNGGTWSSTFGTGTGDSFITYLHLSDLDKVLYKVYAQMVDDETGNGTWSAEYAELMDEANLPPNCPDILTPNGTAPTVNYTTGDIINISYNWLGDPNLDGCFLNITVHDELHNDVYFLENRAIPYIEYRTTKTFWYNWDTTGLSSGGPYHVNVTAWDASLESCGVRQTGVFWINASWNTTTEWSWNGTIYNVTYWNTLVQWNGSVYNATAPEQWYSLFNWSGAIYNASRVDYNITINYPVNGSSTVYAGCIPVNITVEGLPAPVGNITIYSNYSGSWQPIYQQANITNGTWIFQICDFNESDTTYWMNASISEHNGNTTNSTVIDFTTAKALLGVGTIAWVAGVAMIFAFPGLIYYLKKSNFVFAKRKRRKKEE